MECKHHQFECNASIARLTDKDNSDIITGYAADITIKCAQCGIPFEWLGLQAGYAPDHPMVSFDATTLRAPIRPSTDPVEHTNAILSGSKIRSLENISNEHALKVAEIFGGTGHISDEAKIFQVKEVLSGRFNKTTNLPGIKWLQAFNYLQQLGYQIEQ